MEVLCSWGDMVHYQVFDEDYIRWYDHLRMEAIHDISQAENCFEICNALWMEYNVGKAPGKLFVGVTFLQLIYSGDWLYVHSARTCRVQDEKTRGFRGGGWGMAHKRL